MASASNIEFSDSNIISADPEAVSCELGTGAAILDLRNGAYFSLNSVGAFVWDEIAQPRSIAELCAAILNRYDVSEDQCRSDLSKLLSDLNEASLIRISNGAPA